MLKTEFEATVVKQICMVNWISKRLIKKNMSKGINRRVVVITGTNSGFGWLTAHSVAALGHKVYALMRDTNGKNAAKAKALSQVENISILDVNLTDERSAKSAVGKIIEEDDKIDVLVNNAGIGMTGVAESFTTADVQEMLDVNVLAPWRLMKLALPGMRKQSEGLIINVSSGSGRFSFPFSAVYGASKFALEGLSEGLHYEVRRLGVDVCIVQPGAFPTEMSQKSRAASDASVNAEYEAIAAFPEKMVNAVVQLFEAVKPDPQDVADAVVNLINLSKGQRPLRTVVDPMTGQFVEAANEAVQIHYAKALTAFGMRDLLTN
jgi:NAD(P)-dependent dehydrogenase (short-subunit alcohol dehydrogenase family)